MIEVAIVDGRLPPPRDALPSAPKAGSPFMRAPLPPPTAPPIATTNPEPPRLQPPAEPLPVDETSRHRGGKKPGNVRRLLSYSRPNAGRLVWGFVVAIFGVVLELARPFPMKLVIDHALLGRPFGSRTRRVFDVLPGSLTPNWIIAWTVCMAVLISIGAAVASIVTVKIILRSAFDSVVALATETFQKLQGLSLAYHRRHAVGDMLQRASSDVFVAQLLVSGVIFPAGISVLTLGGMFIVMARIDSTLALIALIVIPMQALSFVVFARGLSKSTEHQWKEQGETMALTENLLGAVKAVQGFGRERYFARRMEQSSRRLGNAYYSATMWGTGYQQAVAGTTGIATAIMLGIGAQRVRDGDLTIGSLFVFISYLGALYGPVRELAQAVGVAVQVNSRAQRVFTVLDSDELIAEVPSPHEFGRVSGKVSFRSVTFGYERSNGPILDGISFDVDPGEVVAIVGISGAGKTSLVSLLSRFADPWSGQVLIDDVDICTASLRSVRSNVGLVLQEPYLLPLSIADNIAFGPDHHDRARVEQAARAAQAHDFIMRLPDGYDTVLGERGVTLSGGERQRLSIARAIMADTPILVLDEPTSALDAHTEARIFNALEAVMENRTVFIISHRLSTIRRADKIITIADGRVCEVGTHESLLAAGASYAELYRKQHLEAR